MLAQVFLPFSPPIMAPSRPRSLRALAFGSRRSADPGPPSPTFSDTTNVSGMNFGANGPEKIITRANLKASLQAYEDVCILSVYYFPTPSIVCSS